jgi:hypothetical protein
MNTSPDVTPRCRERTSRIFETGDDAAGARIWVAAGTMFLAPRAGRGQHGKMENQNSAR